MPDKTTPPSSLPAPKILYCADCAEAQDACKCPFPVIWGKQPYEPQKALKYFTYYRELEDRTIAKVAEQFPPTEAGIRKVAREWCWAVRIEAYDAHKDRERRELARRQRESDYNLVLTAARGAVTVAAASIESLLKQVEMAKKDNADFMDLSVNETKELFQMGAKYIQLEAGKPTEHVHQTTPADVEKQTRQDAVNALRENVRLYPLVKVEEHAKMAADTHDPKRVFGITPEWLMAEVSDVNTDGLAPDALAS